MTDQNRTSTSKIGFAGLTHLGITASVCSATLGYQVVAFDPEPDRIAQLAAGRLPIHEPGMEQLLLDVSGAITFTSAPSDLASCALVIVCLDIATDSENRSDLRPLEALIQNVGKSLGNGATLVIMSQVPAGFSRSVLAKLGCTPGMETLNLYYWVETLVIGRAIERFLKPERLIIGSSDSSAPQGVFADYLSRLNAPIILMNFEGAELTKTAINLYLSASVCFANFISDLCEHHGASMRQVTTALRMDKRIGLAAYIRPSLGIAGGNLERDLVSLCGLAQRVSVPDNFVRTIISLNQSRCNWAIEKIRSLMSGHGSSAKIAFLGIAYKKDTKSIKNSIAVRVMSQLEGQYKMSAYDPQAVLPPELQAVVSQETLDQALHGAHLAVVITEWDEFTNVFTSSMRQLMQSAVILDCCGIIDVQKARADGFRLITMGEGQT